MTIHIGADHGGFALKEKIKENLASLGHTVIDAGAAHFDPLDDFPQFGIAAARETAKDPSSRGILICRSGFGMDMVANKVKGIRCALAISPEHVMRGRHDEDINMVSLPADFISEEAATAIVEAFLTTPFANEEKYSRRLGEIATLES